MQRRNNQFNPKRRIQKCSEVDATVCTELASKVTYGGNSEHKKNPGDFGLTPPSGPRAGKSLCDSAKIFSRKEALKYLKQGLAKGLISDRYKGLWPQNIWSVTNDGIPLEAQLENPETGSYHGYPMPQSDPLAEEVLQRWKEAT
jgi:hypothetical protein